MYVPATATVNTRLVYENRNWKAMSMVECPRIIRVDDLKKHKNPSLILRIIKQQNKIYSPFQKFIK